MNDDIPDTDPAPALAPFVDLGEAAADTVSWLAPEHAQALPVLRLGSTGPTVERWQAIIGATRDGIFGDGTARLTRVWQAAHGLEQDGIAGPRSWAEALGCPTCVSTAPPAPPAPTPGLMTGVDVSQWQPPGLVDYAKLAAGGARFAIARATYGTMPDAAFPGHVAAARAAGLQVGGYHFFRQHQPMAAQLEALCRALDVAGGGDIVPAIDLETNSSGYDGPLDPAAHNGAGRALVEAVAAKFGEALVYMSPGHWLELGRPSWPTEHALWVADWLPGATGPRWPRDGWALWQCSATYRTPAFPRGPLDLDRARRLPLIR